MANADHFYETFLAPGVFLWRVGPWHFATHEASVMQLAYGYRHPERAG